MAMTELEREIVAVALEKTLKSITESHPKSGETLRTMLDDSFIAEYRATGADRKRLNLNGFNVGTYSLTFTSEKRGHEMRVSDPRKLVEWLRKTDEGADVLGNLVVGSEAIQAISDICTDFGFLPDGCEMIEVHEPSRIKGTSFRVDEGKVISALGGQLPSAVAGLLGGEVE